MKQLIVVNGQQENANLLELVVNAARLSGYNNSCGQLHLITELELVEDRSEILKSVLRAKTDVTIIRPYLH